VSIVNDFLDWAAEGLNSSDEAQAYLMGRGVSREQFVRHRLGFVGGNYEVDPSKDAGHNSSCSDFDLPQKRCDSCRLNRWTTLWKETEEGSPKEKITGARIINCIVLPLSSYSGTYYGFQIRSIIDKNYDTFSLRRRPEALFFGLAANIDYIWSKKETWIVEGPFDQLILERLIARNVVAMTTNALGDNQAKFVKRFCESVILCLDRDKGGREGKEKTMEKLQSDLGELFPSRIVNVPKVRPTDKDLGDLWKRVGDEKFVKMIKSAALIDN